MASLDSLPADQRAVLQLLLKQGKSYDDLSTLLRIEATAVRDRARDAIDALGPEDDAVDPDRRDEIADYLLGQQSASRRAATREYLEGSASGRAWARSVAGTLAPLAPDGLPDIPSEREEVAAAFDALDRRTERRKEVERSSRTGGILVLVGLGLALAVGLVLLISGGDDDDDESASTSTNPATQILATAQMTPPGGERGEGQPIGVAFVVRQGEQTGLYIQGQELEPTTDEVAYGIWLRGANASNQRFLGYIQARVEGEGEAAGILQSISQLAVPIEGFRTILVTRESEEDPQRPENIVLSGPLRKPTPEEQRALQQGGAGQPQAPQQQGTAPPTGGAAPPTGTAPPAGGAGAGGATTQP